MKYQSGFVMSSSKIIRRGASKVALKKKISMQSKIPGWLWLITSFATGFFLSYLIQYTSIPVVHISNAIFSTESAKKEISPVFDFYTVLPESEMLLPISNKSALMTSSTKESYGASRKEAATISKNPEKSELMHKSRKYLLQAGSFLNAEDADRLSTQLLLAGQQPQIIKTKIGSESLHQVQLGPFETNNSIEQAKKILNNFKIDGLLLRMP